MNIPSTPLLNIAYPSTKQPVMQDSVAPRFGSKLDELRREIDEFNCKQDARLYEQIGDVELHLTTGETFRVVNFIEHLYEHGQCSIPEMLESLPMDEKNIQILRNAFHSLVQHGLLLTTDNTDDNAKFGVSKLSYHLKRNGYIDLASFSSDGTVYATAATILPEKGQKYNKRIHTRLLNWGDLRSVAEATTVKLLANRPLYQRCYDWLGGLKEKLLGA